MRSDHCAQVSRQKGARGLPRAERIVICLPLTFRPKTTQGRLKTKGRQFYLPKNRQAGTGEKAQVQVPAARDNSALEAPPSSSDLREHQAYPRCSQDNSVDKSTCWEGWQPEFDPHDSHGRRREPCPKSCPLTSTFEVWHACTQHTHIILTQNKV